MKICDLNPKIIRPNEKVSIADLSQFIEFNPQDARRYDTAVHCIAYDALVAQYEKHEMVDGNNDYYDGFWMKFADGSEIRYYK